MYKQQRGCQHDLQKNASTPAIMLARIMPQGAMVHFAPARARARARVRAPAGPALSCLGRRLLGLGWA